MTEEVKTPFEAWPIEDRDQIKGKMGSIKHKIIVLSGKGGVGKSTVAVNLAAALVMRGFEVGLLDIDIHGPSIPKLLGIENKKPRYHNEKIFPVEVKKHLKVMSIGFLLKDREDAVIWRGPVKIKVIQQFLRDVVWKNIDFLIVDSPPGTGDEPLSVIQLLPDPDGAVIVTTPQQVSVLDVERSIRFCRKLGLQVLGVIENMSGFVCPHCGKKTDIFKSGGGEKMAKKLEVPFLGRIPIEPDITALGDRGEPYLMEEAATETAFVFEKVIEPIAALEKGKGKSRYKK